MASCFLNITSYKMGVEGCGCPLCKDKTRKCPKCGRELSRGKTVRQKDGTEYTPLICPVCRKRLVDVKMPYEALLGRESPEAG